MTPVFTPIGHEQLVADVLTIAAALAADDWRPTCLIGVGRGGLVPAVYLSHASGLPTLSCDLSSQVKDFADDVLVRLAARTKQCERLLFIDDINDSGRTIGLLRARLAEAGAPDGTVRFATLLDNVASAERVDYRARTLDRRVTKDWFVFPWEALAPSDSLAADAAPYPNASGSRQQGTLFRPARYGAIAALAVFREGMVKQADDWHLTDTLDYEHGRGDPFAAAVRATRMPMVVTDPAQPDNPIVFCNVAFQTLTGYAREEIIGRNCRFLQGPDTDQTVVDTVRAAIKDGHDVDVDLLNYRKDGTTFWNALYMSPVRDKEGVVRFFFASQLDVTERVEAQNVISQQKELVEREVERRTADLRAALDAKTILLHEVDHRVKNNLTMIGSLLRLQVRTIDDPEMAAKLDSMLERVDALAVVHRQLYQSSDITTFDIGSFAESLTRDVVGSSGRTDIVVDVEAQPLLVDAAHASALGLILNEILINSIKHAYADGRSGKLTLAVENVDDRGVIRICDDGPGLPSSQRTKSIGTSLITRLARQARAEAVWTGNAPGTCVTITFPRREAA